MEQYSYDFYNNIKDKVNTFLLAPKNEKENLFIFLLRTFFYILKNKKKFSNIHFGDGLLGPLAYISCFFTKAKTSITIHGLDITYRNPIYQLIIPFTIARLHKIICVSRYTIEECVKHGVPEDRCVFIPNGIDVDNLKDMDLGIEMIENKYKVDLQNKKILFSIGRLVKRKGNAWFVERVMPKLSSDYIYLIAGDGPEKKKVEKIIQERKLGDRVFLLGKIPEEDKVTLYKHSDLFIMPNVKVKGDPEGFGITLIESAAYGLPCIASKVEGIRDAVIEGKTGFLIDPENENEIKNKIEKIMKSKSFRSKVRENGLQYIKNNYDWKILSERIISELKKVS